MKVLHINITALSGEPTAEDTCLTAAILALGINTESLIVEQSHIENYTAHYRVIGNSHILTSLKAAKAVNDRIEYANCFIVDRSTRAAAVAQADSRTTAPVPTTPTATAAPENPDKSAIREQIAAAKAAANKRK